MMPPAIKETRSLLGFCGMDGTLVGRKKLLNRFTKNRDKVEGQNHPGTQPGHRARPRRTRMEACETQGNVESHGKECKHENPRSRLAVAKTGCQKGIGDQASQECKIDPTAPNAYSEWLSERLKASAGELMADFAESSIEQRRESNIERSKKRGSDDTGAPERAEDQQEGVHNAGSIHSGFIIATIACFVKEGKQQGFARELSPSVLR